MVLGVQRHWLPGERCGWRHFHLRVAISIARRNCGQHSLSHRLEETQSQGEKFWNFRMRILRTRRNWAQRHKSTVLNKKYVIVFCPEGKQLLINTMLFAEQSRIALSINKMSFHRINPERQGKTTFCTQSIRELGSQLWTDSWVLKIFNRLQPNYDDQPFVVLASLCGMIIWFVFAPAWPRIDHCFLSCHYEAEKVNGSTGPKIMKLLSLGLFPGVCLRFTLPLGV